MPHPVHQDELALRKQCQMKTLRRSGPGGQHRNKVETAVVLTHLATGIRAEANEARSQAENLKNALLRLRVNLALKIRSDSPENVPGTIWQKRCKNGRIVVSQRHNDFANLIADALDCLKFNDWQLKPATTALGCSSSQLVKFLKIEPRAFQNVNYERGQIGLAALK